MSKNWYLKQNQDVLESKLNPFYHFIKYGRKELRTWKRPKWFLRALGVNGWVWSNSDYFFSLGIVNKKFVIKNYEYVKIYRYGIYKQEIKNIRKKLLKSSNI